MPTGTSNADIVTFIYDVLGKVDGIGKRFKLPRDLTNLDTIRDAFTTGTPARINAWVIQREATRTSRERGRGVLPSGQEHRFHTYVVRHYYEVSDDLESEVTFQANINAVLDAFLERRIRVDAGDTLLFEDTDEIGFRIITVQSLAGHFVHYAELELIIRERIRGVNYLSATA